MRKYHTYSTEVLTHFKCGSCSQWWTLADHNLFIDRIYICPVCHHKNKAEEIK